MKYKFEIEGKANVKDRPYVFARSITKNPQFKLTEHARLGGAEIKKDLQIPRSLSKDGIPRIDVFVFHLKHSADLAKFEVGKTVELEP